MQIVLGILSIVLLYIFWDYIIYIIGGTLILIALICVWLTISSIQDAKLSPDEWQEKEEHKKEKNPQYKISQKQPSTKSALIILIIAILLGVGGYKMAFRCLLWVRHLKPTQKSYRIISMRL